MVFDQKLAVKNADAEIKSLLKNSCKKNRQNNSEKVKTFHLHIKRYFDFFNSKPVIGFFYSFQTLM